MHDPHQHISVPNIKHQAFSTGRSDLVDIAQKSSRARRKPILGEHNGLGLVEPVAYYGFRADSGQRILLKLFHKPLASEKLHKE